MASITPKPPPLLIPDLGNNSENSVCRLCLVNNIGQVEFLHHNISAPHVKKLKAHIRLRSQCMICPVYMSDIKAAEAHVQDLRHERRISHGFKLKAAVSFDQKYRCPPCRLVFNCSIALELHLFMSHKVTFSTKNLPELSEIILLLSGSSTNASKLSINPECVLCEVKCEAMDDFLMHLFSNVHLKSLRTSTCIVCELKFIHVNDREGHLHAWKHKFHLQKVCLSNRLKKLKDMGQGENIGYTCMYCMIWCKSWPCFMLHLLGSAHRTFAENQDHQYTNLVVNANLQSEKVETNDDASVSSISEPNWKRWLDQSSGLSSCCLICEEMVPIPEALEKHLEGHHSLQTTMPMKMRNHRLNSLSREGKPCDYFECEVCCVIFKNEFSLIVHKSLQQHHIQQACELNDGVLCRCFDCRMRARSTASEKAISLKSNSMVFEGGKLEENVTTIQNHSAKEFTSEGKKETSDKSSKSGECQAKINIVSEKIMPNHLSGVGNCIVRQPSDTRNLTANVAEISQEPSNKAFKSLSSSIEKEKNIKCGVNVESGTTFCKDNPRGHVYPGATETRVPVEMGETGNEVNVELNGCQEKNLTQSGILSGYKEMVPVVIAAALPPSDSIQYSILSALKLVKESLSAAVPKIRKNSEVFSANKRLKGNNCDTSINKHDCRSLQHILEAAVSEGLQSLISHSSLQKSSTLGQKEDSNSKEVQKTASSTCGIPNKSGGPPMSISAENMEGVSVAFAAAVIPRSSTTQVALHTSKSKNHETSKEKTRVGRHQEINGVRKVFQATNCVHDEKLRGMVYTQCLNTAHDDDLSSDSDDHRVYLPPDDTESSED